MIIDMPTVSMGNSGSILPAEKVSYDNTTSGLEAENVQDAIDEVNSNLGDYTTSEKVVGKWIDGRPVYQKTIYKYGFPKGTVTIDGTLNTNTVEYIQLVAWFMRDSRSGAMWSENADYIGAVNCISTGLSIIIKADWNDIEGYFTVQYVKK